MRFLTIFAVSILLLSLFYSPVCAETVGETGYRLEQNSKLNGASSVLLTSSAVKVSFPGAGITVICKAPDWQVWMYSDREKTVFDCPLNKFHGLIMNRVAAWMGQSNLQYVPVSKTGTVKFLDLACDQFLTNDEFAKKQRKEFGVSNKTYPENVECTTMKTSAYHPQQVTFLAIANGLPSSLTGIPLEVKYVDLQGGKHMYFNTNSQKQAKIAASEFVAPSKYKHVSKQDDLVIDNAGMEGLMDIMDSKLNHH